MEVLFAGYGLKVLRERRRNLVPLIVVRSESLESEWELRMFEPAFGSLIEELRRRLELPTTGPPGSGAP